MRNVINRKDVVLMSLVTLLSSAILTKTVNHHNLNMEIISSVLKVNKDY